MAHILLVGPGAIGATLAAWLAQDDRHDVTVAVRTPFDSLEVTTPSGVIRAKPRQLTDPSQASPVDWILVTTKAYDSEAANAWFGKATGPRTRLAVIQNGVEQAARFEKHFDPARLVPVMIDLPVDRTAPGRTIQRGPAKIVVPAGPNGADFVALFAHTNFDVTQTDDFTTAVWRKLCLNSAGAVNVVTDKPAGIAHHDGVAEVIRAIVRECIAVGRAEGATLADSIPDDIVAGARRAPRDAANSMLADRRAGRPMEIEARNGVIVRLGAKHGVATPMNALMVALLEGIQQTPEK
ncbi:MAG TPA: 2-dehydropantoate 2-reductase [Steroidobacteraceae bacterium]|nr:2-dehydropantoate 2-reductase [Steroidobacteraceae bacterium]